jgi:hypothetical protein
MAAANIKGTWTKIGNEYSCPNHKFNLVMGNRKNAIKNKPNQYLLIKKSKSDFTYLSGLFPIKESDTFSIDWMNQNYQLTFINSTTFEIS